MKQMKITETIAAIFLLAMLVSGCMKGDYDFLHEPGTPISFGVSEDWLNDFLTRTEYSGKDEQDAAITKNSKYERINWMECDRIRVFCEAAQDGHVLDGKGDDYSVSAAPTYAAEKSFASTKPTNKNGIRWGTGDHYFYAMYPAPGMTAVFPEDRHLPSFTKNNPVTDANAKLESVTGNKAKISGVIPAEQEVILDVNDPNYSGKKVYKANMNYAYMYAGTKVDEGTRGKVKLSFKPLVTTLEFQLQSIESSPIDKKLTKVELSSSSTPLTGSFTATLSMDEDVAKADVGTPTNTGSKITIELPDGGIMLSSTPVIITFLTLPVDQTNLTLTLYFGEDGATYRTLDLKDSAKITADNPEGWIIAPACKKVYIKNLGVPGDIIWTYHIGDLTGLEVEYDGGSGTLSSSFTSYREQGETEQAVPYTLEYSEYDYETGTWSNWSEEIPDWLSGVPSEGEHPGKTSTEGETLHVTVAAQENSARDEHHIILSERPAKVNFDLSKVSPALPADSPGGWNQPSASSTTANCYVVQAPGTYCFPLVYGNGIKDGGPNQRAYRASKGWSDGWRPDNGHTVSVTLEDKNSATFTALGYFKDALGVNIKDPYLSVHLGLNNESDFTPKLIWEDAEGLIDRTSLAISKSEDGVMYLHFGIPENTITQGNALVAVDVGGIIVWSWHIWVTDVDLSDTKEGSGNACFAPVNIGWCDRVTTQQYKERKCLVHAIQKTDGGAVSNEVLVIENSMGSYLPPNSPFYQWGRKDPLLVSYLDMTDKTYYYYEDNYKPEIVENSVTIDEAIQNPWRMYASGNDSNGDWVNKAYLNLWNSIINSQVLANSYYKTIYDPSPVGFVVPTIAAYKNITKQNTLFVQDRDGISGRVYGGDLFFPMIGFRNYFDGRLRDDAGSLYHSSNPQAPGRAYHLHANKSYASDFDIYCNGHKAYATPIRPILDASTAFGVTTFGQHTEDYDLGNYGW